jgi:uncharacterized protein YjbI with pentapeptide repeats
VDATVVATVVAALIGAGATIYAAILGVRWARKPQESPLGTEGFTESIRQLGDERLEVRLSGIYALEERAKDPEEHWPIMEILANYVRERSPRKIGRELEENSPPELSPDVRAILKVLGRRTLFYGSGEEQRLDLTGTDLRYANLFRAHLEGVDLREADLEETKLEEAHLEKADLRGAYLAEAVLDRACLEEADLREAYLEMTSLKGARLRSVDFRGATFRRIVLNGQDASEADFSETDLSNADLRGSDFSGAFFQESNLSGSNLSEALFPNANLTRANLSNANLSDTDFSGATLSKADLAKANLTGGNFAIANLAEAVISDATLSGTNFRGADFLGANLSNAVLSDADLRAVRFVGTNLEGTTLTDCKVYGVSAWDLMVSNETKQSNLIISPEDTNTFAKMDDLEVAQFIYLLLDNRKLRNVIEATTSMAVLILGNFPPERKEILEAIRERLRDRRYLPIFVDFEAPNSRNLIDMMTILADLSRFVIADITQPRSVLQELYHLVPNSPRLPIQPLILRTEEPTAVYSREMMSFDSVLKLHRYASAQDLLESFDQAVIASAEQKRTELEENRLRPIFME